MTIRRRQVALEQLDRCFFPADDAALRTYVERHGLAVPHRGVERLARWLPASAQRAFPGVAPNRWLVSSDGDVLSSPPSADSESVARLTEAVQIWSRVRFSRAILVTDYPGAARSQLLLFAFDDYDHHPSAVIKVRARGPGAVRLARERIALQSAGLLPQGLKQSVPAYLEWMDHGDVVALSMAHLHGRSAYGQMRASIAPGFHVRRHLSAALEWLGAFHDATRSTRQWDPDQEGEEVIPALPDSAAADFVRQQIAQVRSEWKPGCGRLAWSHGDFWARNVLVNGVSAATGVVDWEHYQPEAPTFHDVFHFAATYGMNYRWRETTTPEQAFARTFIVDTRLSRSVRRYLARYCLRTGISPALLPSLLTLYLARRQSTAIRSPEDQMEDPALWTRCLRLLANERPLAFSG